VNYLVKLLPNKQASV